MASISDLPSELITEIFAYLSRIDRFSCSMVCSSWNDALDSPFLWKNMVVYFDSDLMEPSTVVATKLYCEHFKAMEFCWANPHLPTRWMQHGSQEFSKRACHYLMLLQDSYIQLKSVKIIDWWEAPKFKKITYHLCKFLRSQMNLIEVSFLNVNFNRVECVKLLTACLSSLNTLEHLDISHCRHANTAMFESVTFISCVERLSNLRTLKLDYTSLCGGIIDSIIISKNMKLELLDVTINDYDQRRIIITEQSWSELHLQCPKLKVAMHIKNICHFEDVHRLLRETIPLTTFSLTCGRIWDQSRSRQYRRTISLLMQYYFRTLENLDLQISYNREVVDDLLLALIHKCVKLKCFTFYGVVESMELLTEICKMETENKENGFKYFHIIPNNMNPDQYYILLKLHQQFSKKFKECNVDFKICNTSSKNLVYVYY